MSVGASFGCTIGDGLTSCPTSCPATLGSSTPAVMSGTTYAPTGVASVSCLNGFSYGAFGTSIFDEIYATGDTPANDQIVVCFHSGGGQGGTRTQCWDNVSTPYGNYIAMVQKYHQTPNRLGGGKQGIVVYTFDYRLNPQSGNQFAQWQDVKCASYWLQANAGTTPFFGNPSLISALSWSWGSLLNLWMSDTPNNWNTNSCSSTTATPSGPIPYITASMSTPTSLAVPNGNSMYDGYVNSSCAGAPTGTCNTLSTGINAINALCNISGSLPASYNVASARACDTGTLSPYSAIVQGNQALLAANLRLLMWGGNDSLILCGVATNCIQPWGTGGGGNMVNYSQALAALSPPIILNNNVYTTCYGYSGAVVNTIWQACPHGGDVGASAISTYFLNDGFNFLLGISQGKGSNP